MGDVFQWFRPGDGTWGQRAQKAHEKVEGWLNVSGIPTGVGQDELKAHFQKFYSTVRQVKMLRQGSAQVLFGYVAERDKAIGEMNGQPIKGCPLILSKHSPAEPVQITSARKRGRGAFSDDEIQKLLLEREVGARLHRPHAHHTTRARSHAPGRQGLNVTSDSPALTSPPGGPQST
jgi:RNA recognition motif-containing protein